jgi:hypothetical protein
LNLRGALLRHKLYITLKIAKPRIPGLRRIRLLKTSSFMDQYGERPILEAGQGNLVLLQHISAGRSIAAGKIGDCELEALLKYEMSGRDPERFFHSITDRGHEMDLLYVNCGVFPKRADAVARWAETFHEALADIDLLAVWHNKGEDEIAARYAPQATLTRLRALEPYYHSTPWTGALAGKRVLVVTPFEETMSLQRRRHRGQNLFPDAPAVFPDFELSVVRSPFPAALVSPVHSDWNEALHDMRERIRGQEFDVCLVGAGAYSLPLCAFVRTELSRPAVHLGGAMQILFGIRGKRWDGHPVLKNFYNENWIRPLPSERPKGRWRVEGAAYW